MPADIDEAGRQRYKDHCARPAPIMATQCALDAPESNLDWQEIKKALEAQNTGETVWAVERENTYAGKTASPGSRPGTPGGTHSEG